MATITQNLEQIRTSKWGREVRSSIYEAILACYNNSSNGFFAIGKAKDIKMDYSNDEHLFKLTGTGYIYGNPMYGRSEALENWPGMIQNPGGGALITLDCGDCSYGTYGIYISNRNSLVHRPYGEGPQGDEICIAVYNFTGQAGVIDTTIWVLDETVDAIEKATEIMNQVITMGYKTAVQKEPTVKFNVDTSSKLVYLSGTGRIWYFTGIINVTNGTSFSTSYSGKSNGYYYVSSVNDSALIIHGTTDNPQTGEIVLGILEVASTGAHFVWHVGQSEDLANSFDTKINQAISTSNDAKAVADEAKRLVDNSPNVQAAQALEKANEALTKAQNAKAAADSAKTNADWSKNKLGDFDNGFIDWVIPNDPGSPVAISTRYPKETVYNFLNCLDAVWLNLFGRDTTDFVRIPATVFEMLSYINDFLSGMSGYEPPWGVG